MKKCFKDVVEKIDQELASSEENGIILDVYQLNNQWALVSESRQMKKKSWKFFNSKIYYFLGHYRRDRF